MPTIRELADDPKFRALSAEAQNIVFDRVASQDNGFGQLSSEAKLVIRQRVVGGTQATPTTPASVKSELGPFNVLEYLKHPEVLSTVARTAPQVVGYMMAGPVGGGVGGAVGYAADQWRTGRSISPSVLALEGALGAIPAGKGGATLLRNLGKRALQGGLFGLGGGAARIGLEEHRLPTPQEALTMAGTGGVLGGVLGGVEHGLQTPHSSAKTPTPQPSLIPTPPVAEHLEQLRKQVTPRPPDPLIGALKSLGYKPSEATQLAKEHPTGTVEERIKRVFIAEGEKLAPATPPPADSAQPSRVPPVLEPPAPTAVESRMHAIQREAEGATGLPTGKQYGSVETEMGPQSVAIGAAKSFREQFAPLYPEFRNLPDVGPKAIADAIKKDKDNKLYMIIKDEVTKQLEREKVSPDAIAQRPSDYEAFSQAVDELAAQEKAAGVSAAVKQPEVSISPVKPFQVPPKQFAGEFHDQSGNYLGDLHKVGEGQYRVRQVEFGKVKGESDIIPSSNIEKAGGQNISATQSVKYYRLKSQGQNATPAQPKLLQTQATMPPEGLQPKAPQVEHGELLEGFRKPEPEPPKLPFEGHGEMHSGLPIPNKIKDDTKRLASILVGKVRAPYTEPVLTSRQMTHGNLREALAKVDLARAQRLYQLKADRAIIASNPGEWNNFIDAVESRNLDAFPLSTDTRRIAQAVLPMQRHIESELQRSGLVQTFREHYWPGLWKQEGRPSLVSRIMGRRPLTGPESFRKGKVFPTNREARDAGMVPVVDNPLDQLLLSWHEKERALAMHELWNQEKAAGRLKFKPFAQRMPEGYARVDDKIARVMHYSDLEKGFVMRGEWVMPVESAHVLNTYLTPGLRGNMLYDAVNRLGNTMTQIALGLSGYHAKVSATTSAASDVALGIQKLFAGQRMAGIQDLVRGASLVGSPIRHFHMGQQFRRQLLKGMTDAPPEVAERVAQFLEGGSRVHWSSYQHSAVEAFVDAFRAGKKLTMSRTAIPAFFEATMKPIFEHLVPNIKMGAFLDRAAFELSKLPPNASKEMRRAVFGHVQDNMDNRFGLLIYDNLVWKRTLKDLGHVSALSLGWQTGSVREVGGGILNARKLAHGELTPETAFTLGMTAVAMIEGTVLTYLFTGRGPQSIKDYFYPPTGRVDPKDGREVRLAPASYTRDVYGMSTHPISTIVHKANPIWRPFFELIQNEDFYGAELREPSDPYLKQTWDLFAYMADQFTPFTLRNLRTAHQLGNEGLMGTGGFLGYPRAPADIERTAEEQEAVDLRRRRTSLRKKRHAEQTRPRGLNELLGITP